ncbi:fatty Acid CoA Synthetase family [Caenorhabditis elegans]|uniref:Fatty Acid CoA Synthetase family n=1 Tax=Caenorhabditis elegans TaxID=6239 RepID=O02200_CAEEL|nr:fatty Acid CoA Synthetase family [Caenorhabditis elegans]CAB02686.1 fatty Acid CoA Synthetase family [Caenorhabditis elegans]|eukprot:NP_506502.1 fatty Acid CoA Synthetase family [Caenorhabditis elegans]
MVFVSKAVPLKLSTQPVHERILDSCRIHAAANKDAIVFIDAETTTKKKLYRDVEPTVNSLATALVKLGFKPGDVAAQAFPNCPEFLIAMLAVMKCGGAMSNASAIFTDYELQLQFKDSNTSIVFTDEDRLARVRRSVAKCPGVRKIICLRTFPLRAEFPENVLDFVELTQTPDQPINVVVSPDAIALLPYSSGTTGRPKGCQLTHKNISAMLDIAQSHLETEVAQAMFGKEKPTWNKEHVLLLLPWYHAYGLNTMLETILLGATGLVFKKFDTIVMLNRIKFYKVKLAWLVPPMLIFLAKDPMVPIFNVAPYLKVIMSAGATAGKQLCEEVQKRFPNAWLCQAYGMTEMVQFTTLPIFEHGNCFETVGSLGPTYEMKILDKEGKEVDKTDTVGQLCFRGPTIMKGYLKKEESDIIDKDGFLKTGDLGSVDQKGRVHVTGRIKELIKVNGMQVPPVEIEDVLLLHPKVKDCAVIGIPDEQKGESPRAYIVKKDHTLTEAELSDFVHKMLSSYKWIDTYEFIDAIPKLPSGKIQRKKLKEMAAGGGSTENSEASQSSKEISERVGEKK